MKKNVIFTLLIIGVGIALATWLLLAEKDRQQNSGHSTEHEQMQDEAEKGPHGGRLLRDGDFAVEIAIFERGVPPEFHVYAYQQEQAIPPQDLQLEIVLHRLGGQTDVHRFEPRGDALRGDNVVTEPHSFDVSVQAVYQGKKHTWQYENYEGRVEISAEIARASGIATERAGPAVIHETLPLTGRVKMDPNRISRVRARFAGVVKKIHAELGDRVRAGELLATVQSNDSLQDYRITAPIDGVIIKRNIQIDEATSDAPLFAIADLSTIWVSLDVFDQDLERVKKGQTVQIQTLDGETVKGKIDWLSPLATHASQSVQARVIVKNSKHHFRPGQFVRGYVTVAQHRVPLAVRHSAIQSFRDFQVVYARVNDTYEVRMLDLGRSDKEFVEVLGGLKAGTEYVTENSYLIKADVEKSGASHDH